MKRLHGALTNLSVDDIDLFAEKINPENENQYFFNGEWKNMVVRKEIIKIKGGKQDTLHPAVYSTRSYNLRLQRH